MEDSFKKFLEEEIKRQKQEKENDNANNTRSNSTGIVRENDKTEPREISQSSSLSDPKRNGGYSTMATLGLSDNLQTIRFKRELSESLSRNTDEPRNTAQSRLSGAESRESRAIISANKEFQNINDEKIPSKLNKEESKEFKDYIKDLRKQTLLSYTKDENVAENILNLQNDLKYYTKKSEILTPNAKKDLEEKIKTSFSKLNNFENANIIPKGTLKEVLNQKELDLCQKISNQSKTKER
ncbi:MULTISPECIES: hypothetical protein [Campylobacter]|uniref:Uncharacterized protein n=1 Tax=Campylobacter jejuni subsp. jejuni serotype O:23/36 (strain 81-176) TaxID=354242 RepID=Q8GJC3_CAMJJ|nr:MULTISPECIES: hypothetical protein [Campylobacter]EAK7017326.1 hypothetical protein [Campylobacter jejuni]ETJ81687.1 hypothetical protein X908_07845 [Campylobacter jejuni subsp. jejuni 81-176-DRH212]ETN89773.1 hypothetical protein X910_09055 [Campylobacter jejuni subsp. jejuni 81-176-UMCW9]AAN46925.1 unknown [Campylobacter jejuni subsp. jejuni 81-176]EAQ71764.1 conserved hypothetical protein [Campylobacter jejuni subsp. jejuni 81-176]